MDNSDNNNKGTIINLTLWKQGMREPLVTSEADIEINATIFKDIAEKCLVRFCEVTAEVATKESKRKSNKSSEIIGMHNVAAMDITVLRLASMLIGKLSTSELATELTALDLIDPRVIAANEALKHISQKVATSKASNG